MQKNSNRKGLALSAALAMVASLFVGLAPAQANENAVVVFPNAGLPTQTTILGTEAFELGARFGNSLDSQYTSMTSPNVAGWGFIVTKPAGVTVSASISASLGNGAKLTESPAAGTEFVTGIRSSGSNTVSFALPGRTSVSDAVAITITPFLDYNNNGARDNTDTLGTPITINFVPWSALGIALTLQQPVANDIGATASFTATAGSVNWAMLDNDFTIVVTHSQTVSDIETTASATIDGADLASTTDIAAANSIDATGQTDKGGFSASFKVLTAPYTTSGVVQSLSASVLYGTVAITSVTTLSVAAANSAGVSISAVAGDNVKLTSNGTAEARFNSAFSVRAFAYSGSDTTSLNVATSVTVSAEAGMELDADSGVIINGVTFTQSARLMAYSFTLPAGTTTFAVSTFGQVDNAGADNDQLTLRVRNGVQAMNLVIDFEPTALTTVFVPTVVSGQAGATRTFPLTVEDQWEVKPVRTDLRIAASVVLSGSTSETVSAPVVAGIASVALAPVPATRTGSAVVTFSLQRFDQESQVWVAAGTGDTAVWNVFSYAAGTDAFVSRTASISASISYGVDLSWSATAIAVRVANSFSDVVVSAPGLMIQNADLTSQTASDTLTVNAASGQNVNLKFTSRNAGTFTVTFTNGTATTTSQVVVNPARDADGRTITFDTTAIAAGSTKVITGTLVDANGNPVNTSGSATILVTYAPNGNAGIPIGTMPTETDKDGKFSITVLTGANDSGTAVVTAVYYKNGAATATADVLSFNQSIVVGGTPAPTADAKLTVGSFKGFVAIYALNYTGQKLSAKVAGRWLVVNDLLRFQRVVRNTGAGFTIKVDLYIDGAFVRSETVVTK